MTTPTGLLFQAGIEGKRRVFVVNATQAPHAARGGSTVGPERPGATRACVAFVRAA